MPSKYDRGNNGGLGGSGFLLLLFVLNSVTFCGLVGYAIALAVTENGLSDINIYERSQDGTIPLSYSSFRRKYIAT